MKRRPEPSFDPGAFGPLDFPPVGERVLPSVLSNQYRPHWKRDRGLQPISIWFFLGMSVLALYNSLGPRELPGQRIGYALMVAGLAVALVVRGRDVRLTARSRALVALAVIGIVAGLAGVMNQVTVYPRYIVGDVVSVAFPLLLFLAGAAEPKLFRNPKLHRAIAVSLFAAALVATQFPDRSGRFEPPGTFLVALLCIFEILGDSKVRKVMAGALLAFLFVIAFQSEVRTAPVLVLAGVFLTWVLAGANTRTILIGGFVAVVLAVGLQSSAAVRRAESVLLESRFKRLVAGEVDESLLSRFLEAGDVRRTAEREWTPVNVMFGAGHGATYQPYQSLVERNLTPEGRVHNIHIGPAMIGFRYGLMGWLTLVALAWYSTRSLLALRADRAVENPATRLHALFTLALILYLADFLLRNVITDPMFSYALAGFLLTRPDLAELRRKPPPSGNAPRALPGRS